MGETATKVVRNTECRSLSPLHADFRPSTPSLLEDRYGHTASPIVRPDFSQRARWYTWPARHGSTSSTSSSFTFANTRALDLDSALINGLCSFAWVLSPGILSRSRRQIPPKLRPWRTSATLTPWACFLQVAATRIAEMESSPRENMLAFGVMSSGGSPETSDSAVRMHSRSGPGSVSSCADEAPLALPEARGRLWSEVGKTSTLR